MSAEAVAGPPRSLYLHLPFCARRCPYCDFAILVGGESLREPYVAAVLRELDSLSPAARRGAPLRSLYLGGGTPSLLPPPLLERLLVAVRQRFGLAPGAEVTLEANPEGITPGLVRDWLSLGINRLSLGVQSLDDPTLRWLGRNHDAAAAEAALATARAAGVGNLSCDLIFAVPSRPASSFGASLSRLLCFQPEHVSCYELTVEPGTELGRDVARRRRPAPSEGDFLEQRRLAREMLAQAGLRRYEISNYARPGHESRHNLNYWQGGAYLAAGCGAHGLLDRDSALALGWELAPETVGVRYWNLRAASTYVARVRSEGQGRRGWEPITAAQHRLELLACGLRLGRGTRLGGAAQLARARQLSALGLIRLRGDRAVATERGQEVLDRVTLELAAAG